MRYDARGDVQLDVRWILSASDGCVLLMCLFPLHRKSTIKPLGSEELCKQKPTLAAQRVVKKDKGLTG